MDGFEYPVSFFATLGYVLGKAHKPVTLESDAEDTTTDSQ